MVVAGEIETQEKGKEINGRGERKSSFLIL